MSQSSGSFNLKNGQNQEIKFGTNGHYLFIQRVDDAVASVCIKDNQGEIIPIPQDFRVKNEVTGKNSLPLMNHFFLGWTDSYTFYYCVNGEERIAAKFSNQRQWTLASE